MRIHYLHLMCSLLGLIQACAGAIPSYMVVDVSEVLWEFITFCPEVIFIWKVIFWMIKIVDKKRNFQLSVESNLGLLWFCFVLLCFALLCDFIWKLARLSEPIRFKLKLYIDLVNHDFLRLSRCPCFCGRFSSTYNIPLLLWLVIVILVLVLR